MTPSGSPSLVGSTVEPAATALEGPEDQDGVAAQVGDLALPLLLLGEQRHRQEQARLASRLVAGEVQRRVELQVLDVADVAPSAPR